jgi:hypothetical protein
MLDAVIQKLVCQAVVSDQYRASLLGSDRAEILRTSGLDLQEQEALMTIRARTIEEFAAGIERMTRQRKRANQGSPAGEVAVLRRLIKVEIPPRNA